MGILIAFVIALIAAFAFSPYKRGDSLMPFAILFLILFLSGLSSQFWIVPFGPQFMGVTWLRILLTVFVFALLISAPPTHRKLSRVTEDDVTVPAISAFIWILLLLLVISIVAGLFYSEKLLVVKPL